MKNQFIFAAICSVFLCVSFASCGDNGGGTDTTALDAVSDVATADSGQDLIFSDLREPDRGVGDDLIDPPDADDDLPGDATPDAPDTVAVDGFDDLIDDADAGHADADDSETTDDVGEPLYSGPCVLTVATDPECDGSPAMCEITEFTATGAPARMYADEGCDGQAPFTYCSWFSYGGNGGLLFSGSSDTCADAPDAGCNTWTRDEFGRALTQNLDEECTGSANECLTYTWDPSGNIRTVQTDIGCAGDSLTCQRRTFDAKGNMLTLGNDEACDETVGDDGNCWAYEYFANGKVKTTDWDFQCQNSPTICYQYDYFSIVGRGTVMVEEQNNCAGGNRICRASTFKGGYNLLTAREVDQGCDGTPSADCRTFNHDANGNVTLETVDSNCDGTADYCDYSRWSGSGALVLQSRIPGCNQPAVDCKTYSYSGNCGTTVDATVSADAEIACGGQIGGNTALSSHAAFSEYNCIGWTPTAKEQMFKYVAPTEGCEYKWEVTATISSLSADLDLLLLSEPDPATCTHKSTALGMADESLTWQAIPGADFYLVIEGYGAATGTYTLDVTCECLTEPLPTCQDSCGGRSPDGTCGCDAACKWLDDCCVDRCEKCPDICAAADCGEIDKEGLCEGNTAKFCLDGVLVTKECGDKECRIVGYGASINISPCGMLPPGACDDTALAYFAYRADCAEPGD